MKKLLTLVLTLALALAMVFTFAACGPKDPEKPDEPDNPDKPGETDAPIADTAVVDLCNGKKVYVTSIGQDSFSTGVTIVKNASGRSESTTASDSTYVKNNLLEAKDIEDGSVVFIVVSGSAKGLGGTNGYTKASETKRATALANAAKENKFQIVVLHVGGKQRRGTLTDSFLDVVCPQAKAVVVKSTTSDNANSDGYFDPYKAFFFTSLAKMATGMAPLF